MVVLILAVVVGVLTVALFLTTCVAAYSARGWAQEVERSQYFIQRWASAEEALQELAAAAPDEDWDEDEEEEDEGFDLPLRDDYWRRN